MNTMKPSIRELWVAALRSGDYKQGQGRLEAVTPNGSEFCCLGVLCDLALKDGVDLNRTVFASDNMIPRKVVTFSGESGVLPMGVLVWSGLSDRVPDLYYQDMRTDMVRLNDGIQLSFAGIADLVEGQL